MENYKNSLLKQALDILNRGYLLDGEKATFETVDGKVTMYHDGKSLEVKIKRNDK